METSKSSKSTSLNKHIDTYENGTGRIIEYPRQYTTRKLGILELEDTIRSSVESNKDRIELERIRQHENAEVLNFEEIVKSALNSVKRTNEYKYYIPEVCEFTSLIQDILLKPFVVLKGVAGEVELDIDVGIRLQCGILPEKDFILTVARPEDDDVFSYSCNYNRTYNSSLTESYIPKFAFTLRDEKQLEYIQSGLKVKVVGRPTWINSSKTLLLSPDY